MNKEELQKMFSETLGEKLAATVETLEKNIDEKLEARIKALGLDKAEKTKIFSLKDTSAEAQDARKMKVASFIKAVKTQDQSVLTKAMSEGTGSAGGYLVPEEFAAEVARIEEDYGLVRKLCMLRPMKSDTRNVPTLVTSVSVTWPGEATAATASAPVFGSAVLSAKTMSGITVYSNELLEDADVDVVTELADLFAEALAGEEDKQGLNGTGSPFTGVLNNTSVNIVTAPSGHDTFAELDLDDYRDLISQVKTSCLPSAAFIMHRSVWGLVQKLKENSQHVTTFPNPAISMLGDQVGAGNGFGLRPAGYLWGYPVYLNDQMPSTTAVSTKVVIFGSLKKGLFFGDRKQMTMKISEEGVVGGVSLLETNQAAVRFTERIALVVGLPTAFAVLKTAAS